jgi:hypothetical protein
MLAAAKHDAENHLISPLTVAPGKIKMRVCLRPLHHSFPASFLASSLRQARRSFPSNVMSKYAIAYFHVSATTKKTLETSK